MQFADARFQFENIGVFFLDGIVRAVELGLQLGVGGRKIVDALVQRVTKNEALSQSNEARITEMEKQVKELRELLTAKKPAASTASAAPVRRAQPRRPARPRPAAVAAAPAPAPKYNGQILSVDMWGGKPSVVISTGDPNDKRVRILSPGESLNGITLKDANVQSRTATFEVGNGRTVQMGVEH